MRRIIVLASACLFLIGIVFTAVAADKKPSEYKIVLLLPGPINDQSWNATNYAGLVQCNKELGTKMEYLESVQARCVIRLAPDGMTDRGRRAFVGGPSRQARDLRHAPR